MAIAESGGTIVRAQWTVPATGKFASLVAKLTTELGNAGMTVAETFGDSVLYSPFGLNVGDGETFTIDGRTYTFKTTLTGAADEIKVGANVYESMNNTKAAINNEAGEGTLYGTGTTVSTVVTAAIATWTGLPGVRMSAIDSGDTGASVSEAGGNLAWSVATLSGRGINVTTATTPQYQKANVNFWYTADSSGNPCNVTLYDRTFNNSTLAAELGDYEDAPMNAGETWEIIANKYQAFIFQQGGAGQSGSCVMFSVPWLPSIVTPKKVTGATNATPIEITTNVAHSYTTGDSVLINYVEGNLAANGTHTITVTGSTTFTLDGVAGDGTFTGTDGLVANRQTGSEEILDVVIANGSNAIGAWGTFPEYCRWGQQQGASMIKNGTLYPKASGDATWVYKFLYTQQQGIDLTEFSQWENGAYVGGEPWIWFALAPGNSSARGGGMLWDTFISHVTATLEYQTTADSKTWMCVSSGSGNDIGDNKSVAQSVWVRIV